MPDTFECYCNGCPYNGSVHLPSTECSSPLSTECPRPLSMEHNPDTTALLIFQAPGCREWVMKRPICSESRHSAAARIENSLSLSRVNASRYDFSITNAVQCYPGKGHNGRDKKPRAAARRQCANWLRMDIKAHPWRRVVVFGAMAKESVRSLGYGCDPRFCFIDHPSGGLPNNVLDAALRWALVRNNADGSIAETPPQCRRPAP